MEPEPLFFFSLLSPSPPQLLLFFNFNFCGSGTQGIEEQEGKARQQKRFVMSLAPCCSVIWTYYKYQEKRNPPLIMNILECWSYIILLCNAAINAFLFAYGSSVVRRFLIGHITRSQVIPSSS